MSADNAIFIMEWGDSYFVWHGSLSAACYEPTSYEHEFENEQDAIDFARKLYEEIGYVEGGIIWIDKETQIRSLKLEMEYLQRRLDNLEQYGEQYPFIDY